MFFTYLRRELLRRRRSALVVASGLALGIALVITVSAVSAGMERAQGSVLQSLYGLGTDMTVTKAPTGGEGQGREFDFGADSGSQQGSDRVVVQGAQTLDAAAVKAVSGRAGVDAAVGSLNLQVVRVTGQFSNGTVTADPGGGEGGEAQHAPGSRIEGGGARFSVNNFSVYGVDVATPALGPMTSSTISSGTAFTAAQRNAAVAVLDSAYATAAKLAVGDTLMLNGTGFNVIGIATASSGSTAANVYVPLQAAQTLAQTPGQVSTIYVKATDSTQLGSLKSAIQALVPGSTVTTSADLAQTVSGSLSTVSDLATSVGRWLSLAVLAAAFLVAALLTSAAVGRRVREFGTLKALGWTSGRVTRQVMAEAVVNGLIGGVLGIALGLAAAYVITTISPTLTAQLGRAGRFGEGDGGGRVAQSLQVTLSAPVTASTIAIAVALAVAGGLVAGGYGGWRAARLRPADALRRIG